MEQVRQPQGDYGYMLNSQLGNFGEIWTRSATPPVKRLHLLIETAEEPKAIALKRRRRTCTVGNR
jgi:hypothetical protein